MIIVTRCTIDPGPPTPVGPSLDQMTAIGTDDALVKSALSQVLQDKTDIEFDVIDFIQHVLGFTPQDIPRRREGYHLSEKECKQFSTRTYIKEITPQEQVIKGEVGCCHAFQAIVWDLVRQLQSPERDQMRSFPAKLMFLQDHPVDGDFASYKPDLSHGAPVGLRLQKWEFMGAVGEVKKPECTPVPGTKALSITVEQTRKVRFCSQQV